MMTFVNSFRKTVSEKTWTERPESGKSFEKEVPTGEGNLPFDRNASAYPAKVVGDRVYLTPAGPAFTEDFLRFLSDYEIAKTLTTFPKNYVPETEAKALANIASDPGHYMFAIVEKGSDKVIGAVSLFGIDRISALAELGIMIGDREYLWKGFGTEAHALMLDFAFEILRMSTVKLTYVGNNARAGASYAKLGYEVFGTLPNSRYSQGTMTDEVYAYVTKEAFRKAVPKSSFSQNGNGSGNPEPIIEAQ